MALWNVALQIWYNGIYHDKRGPRLVWYDMALTYERKYCLAHTYAQSASDSHEASFRLQMSEIKEYNLPH